MRFSHARAASLTSAIHVLLSGVYIGFDLRVSFTERSRDPLHGRKCACADQSGLSIGAHLNQHSEQRPDLLRAVLAAARTLWTDPRPTAPQQACTGPEAAPSSERQSQLQA